MNNTALSIGNLLAICSLNFNVLPSSLLLYTLENNPLVVDVYRMLESVWFASSIIILFDFCSSIIKPYTHRYLGVFTNVKDDMMSIVTVL